MNWVNLGIIVSAILGIIFVLLQDRSSGTGGAFGGDVGGFYQQRRGMEKALFTLTIVAIILFATFSLLNLTKWGQNVDSVVLPPQVEIPEGSIEVKTDNPDVKVVAPAN